MIALVATIMTVAGAGSASAAGELVLAQETAPPKITAGTNAQVDTTYRLTAGSAASVDVQRITVTVPERELIVDSIRVADGGAGGVDYDGWFACDFGNAAGPGETAYVCLLTGSVQPVTSGATIAVGVTQVMYPAFVGLSSMRVAVAGQLTGGGAGVDSNEVTTAVTVHEPPTCAEKNSVSGTLAQLTASGFLEQDLPCTDPEGSDLATIALSDRDDGGHSGTLSRLVDPAGPALPRIRWTPKPGSGGAARTDSFLLEVTDVDGGSASVLVRFEVVASIDLDVAMTGPSSVVFGPTGAEVTYSGTVMNHGPDGASRGWLMLYADQDVLMLSGTLEDADELGCSWYEMSPSDMTCPIGPVAAGEQRAFTVTLRVAADDDNWELPAPLEFTASAMSDDDPNVDPDGPQSVMVRTSFTVAPTPVRPRRLIGSTRADRLVGGDGDDQLDGRAGNDRLFGGAGRDHLLGGSGNDVLSGGLGNDKLEGGAGNDKLDGGVGDDILVCGPGHDVAAGGGGADKLTCKDGAKGDVINGGPGRDMCVGDRGDRFIGCEKIVRS